MTLHTTFVQGVYNPYSFQVEADVVYLYNVYNWSMSLTRGNGESGDMCVKNLSEKEKKVGCLWERRNLSGYY